MLRLLAVGLSNREIGGRLRISEATVKFHVRNLRDKLEVRRRTEIVYTAARQGIV
ncbi:Response regulator, two-component system [Pseudonocardia sp. Ae168_Ps1]|nr:Response regulator, two-component system [Pseudonocardia sp. Ae150A_Ps1]OLL79835.1 Response regulator, two-component system [Pseudonocardia sp. Ae168_Ps1]OLL86032.1 Response regulator, two-component system [Pseudonocardia sp. Ae263_Ps1]OLL93938.1 Response regulator, two-component system [Pseudonocardia sp. Ae356_Ps1]